MLFNERNSGKLQKKQLEEMKMIAVENGKVKGPGVCVWEHAIKTKKYTFSPQKGHVILISVIYKTFQGTH